MEKEENERAHNEIEQQVTADLVSDWKEPSTRGDIRNFAVRMDLQFGKLERRFDKVDAKFDTFKSEIITLINTSGLRYVGAMITANIAMFAIFEKFFAS